MSLRHAASGAKTAGRTSFLIAAWLFVAIVASTTRTRQFVGDWVRSGGRQDVRLGQVGVHVCRQSEGPDRSRDDRSGLVAWARRTSGVAILLSGFTVLGVLGWMSRREPNGAWRLVIGGTLVAVWWPQLAFFGHLDDASVIVVAVVAVECARRGRPMLTAGVAGFAVVVKPTGLFLLALAIPRTGWRSLKSWVPMAVGVAIAVIPWLPFVVVVPQTISASRSTVAVAPDAVVSLFMTVGSQPSGGYRSLQLLLMLCVSGIAMVRAGPTAVLATGVAVRILLDPVTWPYYTPALVVGTLVWEICESQRRVPWLTVAVALMLPTPAVLDSAEMRLWLRLLVTVGVIVVLFLAPIWCRQRSRSEHCAEVHPDRAPTPWV